ncbi:hypothetical protein G5714_002018 [Onychostoma macrolepis]|uniref:Ig-like domain-containing protein n=1 Tax=Onychostoma macrolepis TaxID=369639 RepID=A0A7J6DEQ4_9TELE|nr:hypothetical protein G5714_002018 [Onychostoma macrolepis]
MISGVMAADQIWPNKDANVISTEGESVRLSCSYDTSSRYVTLYWYRQYLNGEPQYLMWKDARDWSSTGTPAEPRFQATTSETSTELTITGVTLSDSALYYCALWSPVIQSLCEAVQKLKFIFHFDLKPHQTTIYNSHKLITLVETPV